MIAPHRHALRGIKLYLGLIFGVLLVYSSDSLVTWPFLRWPLYSEGRPTGDKPFTYQYLRVTDRQNNTHVIYPRDLLTIDDDTSKQPDGVDAVLQAMWSPDDAANVRWLADVVERNMGEPVQTITIVEQTYTVPDPTAPYPRHRVTDETVRQQFTAAHIADARTTPQPPTDATPVLRFGGQFDLLDVLVGRTSLPACDWLYVRTWWQTTTPPRIDYSASFTLADANGVGAARAEGPLNESQAKFWQLGEPRMDFRHFQVPCEPGRYTLLATIYDPATGHNLPVTTPDGAPVGEYAYLTTITVTETAS